MNAGTDERLSRMEKEIGTMRRQLRWHRTLSVVAVAGFGLAMVIGAAPGGSPDARFNRISARSINITNDAGKTVAELDASYGGGSLMLRSPDDQPAMHLIAGATRNDVILYDRRGDIAVVAQGVADEGRLTLHKTFNDQAGAEAALPAANIGSYLVDAKTKRATVRVLRLPEAGH